MGFRTFVEVKAHFYCQQRHFLPSNQFAAFMKSDILYPVGVQSFENLRNSGMIYVDKTAIMHELVRTTPFAFLSRPRRFGKSLLVSTMQAYFEGKRELFKGLAIEQLEQEWTPRPVLHLDLSGMAYTQPEALDSLLDMYLTEWEKPFGEPQHDMPAELRLAHVIRRTHEASGQGVAVLVDEYDKPLVENFGRTDLQETFRRRLRALFGVLKSEGAHVQFAFLTGVSRFSKVSVFSDLNNLMDISLLPKYATLCGLTRSEIATYLQQGVEALAEENGISPEACMEKLREYYDGYHFGIPTPGIYNPFSVLSTISSRRFGSYWFETGTPTLLVDALQHRDYNLCELEGAHMDSSALACMDNEDHNPLPLLYHTGYLTIKAYDNEYDEYTLGFPNKEVEQGFYKFIRPRFWKEEDSTFRLSHFVNDLRDGHPEAFMTRLQAMMCDSNFRIIGRQERYFHNTFFIFFRLLGFHVEVERHTSNGIIDLVLKTKDYLYIMEFKMDRSAQAALHQIRERGYALPFAADGRRVFLIGVNFSSAKRRIDDWRIEPAS